MAVFLSIGKSETFKLLDAAAKVTNLASSQLFLLDEMCIGTLSITATTYLLLSSYLSPCQIPIIRHCIEPGQLMSLGSLLFCPFTCFVYSLIKLVSPPMAQHEHRLTRLDDDLAYWTTLGKAEASSGASFKKARWTLIRHSNSDSVSFFWMKWILGDHSILWYGTAVVGFQIFLMRNKQWEVMTWFARII